MGADGAWRWRRGVEDKYHYRFWGQVARWMAYQRNMAQGDKMRLFFAPDRPKTGGTLTLNANVMSTSGEPLRDGNVIAQIVSPSGKPSTIRFLPAGEESWGLFTGTLTPSEPGDYKIRLSCAEAGTAMETTISVQGTRKEKRGQPARPEVLKEIVLLTRGQLLETTNPEDVVHAISPSPKTRRRTSPSTSIPPAGTSTPGWRSTTPCSTSGPDIATFCVGQAASMAAVLLAAEPREADDAAE